MPVSINVTMLIKVICGKVVIKVKKEQKWVFTENYNVKKEKEEGESFLCHPYTQNIEEELVFL